MEPTIVAQRIIIDPRSRTMPPLWRVLVAIAM
jgi:hypothetical protein